MLGLRPARRLRRILLMSGRSTAHTGPSDLLGWLGVIAPSKPRVVLTHGEDGPRSELARQIQRRFRLPSELPKMGDVIEA